MTGIFTFLLTAGAVCCAEGYSKDTKGKVWIYTDIYNTIRDGYLNLGISYLFHRHWSIAAESGVWTGGRGKNENPEKTEHELELGHTLPERRKPPVHRETIQLCFWPAGEHSGFELHTSVTYDNISRLKCWAGTGYTICIGRHFKIRLGFAFNLPEPSKTDFNNSFSVKFGYNF